MEELSLVEGFGYPYWAGYQLLVVIILLSVLRARMINTYQNIRQEADIKWKFFRANLWWNYLEASLLPPPFTIIEALTKVSVFWRKAIIGCLKGRMSQISEIVMELLSTKCK